jgi:site-specific DNA-cytosine methylase
MVFVAWGLCRRSRLLILGHQVVGFYDSDGVARDEYKTNHPFAAVGGDIESAFADPSFRDAVATADVSFATPPCRTFSRAGNGQRRAGQCT